MARESTSHVHSDVDVDHATQSGRLVALWLGRRLGFGRLLLLALLVDLGLLPGAHERLDLALHHHDLRLQQLGLRLLGLGVDVLGRHFLERLLQLLELALQRNDVDRKSTRLNSSHLVISYAVFCLKKKTNSRQRASLELATESADGDPLARS